MTSSVLDLAPWPGVVPLIGYRKMGTRVSELVPGEYKKIILDRPGFGDYAMSGWRFAGGGIWF